MSFVRSFGMSERATHDEDGGLKTLPPRRRVRSFARLGARRRASISKDG
jgi:hypothetical protein